MSITIVIDAWDEWFYDFNQNCIVIPDVINWTHRKLFALLHEFGHAHFKHGIKGKVTIEEEIQDEIDAYVYALKCIKQDKVFLKEMLADSAIRRMVKFAKAKGIKLNVKHMVKCLRKELPNYKYTI